MAKKQARQVCFKCVRAGRVMDASKRHKAKMCPWSVADITEVELKVPELSRLRNQARTGYSQGVPKKLQKSRLPDADTLELKNQLKVPESSRLRNQARKGYSQGVPKKLQKSQLQDGRYVFIWMVACFANVLLE